MTQIHQETALEGDLRQSIRIKLLLFAAYREIFGTRQAELAVPAGITLNDLFTLLEYDHPSLSALRSATTFAVNREVRPVDAVLKAGDEVAFLQPVSGG